MDKTGEKWTEKEDALLRLLRENRVPCEECAEVLRRTKYAVANRAAKLKLSPLHNHGKIWTSEEEETLKSMRRNGASYRECAEKLNRSMDSIYGRASRLGLTSRDNCPPSLRRCYEKKSRPAPAPWTACGTADFGLNVWRWNDL